jgi:lyso-ornithine lipid O-acyltransferase
LEVLVRFGFLRLRYGSRLSLQQRAAWLHQACSLIVQRLDLRIHTIGTLPSSGLVASNHLSYLDILFYASQLPCIFVSKSEVRSWPMFGILARCGGTIFIERGRAAVLDAVSRRISEALAAGLPILLFPEGTSTDGSTVLPFFPALFEAAVQAGSSITPAAIAYSADNTTEADLCYYGDITFATHLPTVMARHNVHADIAFAAPAKYPDRKTAAKATQEQAILLRNTLHSGARST